MRPTARVLVPLTALLAATAFAATARAQSTAALDAFVRAQMARRHVPGLSLAIVQDGRIVVARAYGVTDRGGTRAVTTGTLFQAGSISKSVAALGALHLVEQGKLALDTDVNATLKGWKLPASAFTATQPVTLRGLLSHTAGLTVHGFPGYATDAAMPTLVQVLDGAPPANTAPIRSDTAPGARWRYSGGGYTIMQQMMLDVTGEPFPAFMRRTVLAPLGMTESSYEQPLPPALAARTAAGHYQDGSVVRGRWHVYPEMAAAGLWTTASDLTRFAMAVQRVYGGAPSSVISPAMAKQMLTEQKAMDGLGVFLEGSGHALRFTHNGRDEGFDALMVATAETGQAMAILINANDDSRMVGRIRDFIAAAYRWPGAAAYPAPAGVSVPPAQLDAVSGRYEMAENQMLVFVARDGRLYTSSSGLPDEEFVPLGGDRFASTERAVRAEFGRDATGAVRTLTWSRDTLHRTVPRVGPLFGGGASGPAEDAALTRRVDAVVRALGSGGAALQQLAGLTEGARRDFGAGGWPPAAGMQRLSYVGAEDVSGRGIRRHGGEVARILYYRMTTAAGERRLLVYLTSDGAVTDVDLVDE